MSDNENDNEVYSSEEENEESENELSEKEEDEEEPTSINKIMTAVEDSDDDEEDVVVEERFNSEISKEKDTLKINVTEGRTIQWFNCDQNEMILTN